MVRVACGVSVRGGLRGFWLFFGVSVLRCVEAASGVGGLGAADARQIQGACVCVCWEKHGGDVVWAVAWPLVVVVVAAASCMCGGVRKDLRGVWMGWLL